MLVTLFIMASFVFMIIRLSPGDPALILLGDVGSPGDYATLRELMGLDRPLLMQYWDFLVRLSTLDFGHSLITGENVTAAIVQRIPPTVTLALGTMAMVILLGVPLGLVAAATVGGPLDAVIRYVTYSIQAVANFWLAILLIVVFAVQLNWLPAYGSGTLSHLVLPVISLGLPLLARVVRFVRSGILDVMNHDYIRTARSKGVSNTRIVAMHAFRPTMIPLITDLGLRLGWLLGGTVIIETVFAWPGLGKLTVEAVQTRDYPLVEGSVLILSTIFLLTNFLVEMFYGALDPRIRYS